MKKIMAIAAMAAMILPAAAQETYESANTTEQDLNGTARYIGMGGAMEALGADVSTITSNPAGVAFFRKAQISMTAGFNNIEGNSVLGAKKVRPSFDQIGVVIPVDNDGLSNYNIGFNYHKSRNFGGLTDVAGSFDGNASQNKLSFNKWNNGLGDKGMNTFNQIDFLYDETFFGGKTNPLQDDFLNADKYEMRRNTKGYEGTFDFNLSANFNSRIYLGLTVGLHALSYKSESEYYESLSNNMGSVTVNDYREISGSGVDVKFGAIFRPVEDSPFRLGMYVNSPIFYELSTDNSTMLTQTTGFGIPSKHSTESYDFHLNTPWKFGLSLGHTIGNVFAFGATYEYSDYTNLDNRVIDGGYYDYDGYWQDESSSDRQMNRHTSRTLKGVSTFKIGGEYKPAQNVSVRLGYNYVSPKYCLDGYKDGTVDSYGSYYASQTDYTNWKATNRFTCGLGLAVDNHFSIDLAYQYSMRDGEFFPFMSYEGDKNPSFDNVASKVNVSDNRHQFAATLSYRF